MVVVLISMFPVLRNFVVEQVSTCMAIDREDTHPYKVQCKSAPNSGQFLTPDTSNVWRHISKIIYSIYLKC